MQKISFVHKVTKIMVDITFILGIALCVCVPFIIHFWCVYYELSYFYELYYDILLVSSGAVAIYAVFEMRKILKSVIEKDPFTENNIISLRRISLCSMILGLIFLIGMIIKFSLPILIVTLVFGFLTLILLTIKDLFKQAVFYKEETDGMV